MIKLQNDVPKNLKQTIGDHKIIQLNDNIFPRGMVPPKRLFDANDVAVK